jgi:hypothetical protein
VKRDEYGDEHKAEEKVKCDFAKPPVSIDAETASEPQDERRYKRPQVASRPLNEKSPLVWDWLAL